MQQLFLDIPEEENIVIPCTKGKASRLKRKLRLTLQLIDEELGENYDPSLDTDDDYDTTKKYRNDEDNTQFTANNITYIAEKRQPYHTCEKDCLAKEYCKYLRCSASSTKENIDIIFTMVRGTSLDYR